MRKCVKERIRDKFRGAIKSLNSLSLVSFTAIFNTVPTYPLLYLIQQGFCLIINSIFHF